MGSSDALKLKRHALPRASAVVRSVGSIFVPASRSTRETDGTLDFTGVWLFEALGVQFWGKSNPAVVVAGGM